MIGQHHANQLALINMSCCFLAAGIAAKDWGMILESYSRLTEAHNDLGILLNIIKEKQNGKEEPHNETNTDREQSAKKQSRRKTKS